MKKICIIPARMASSRFPGKPMKTVHGMPMIEHIWRRCCLNDLFDIVIVATCDEEIRAHISYLGGIAVMTANTHERCTDRVSEAIGILTPDLSGDDLVLMVQGDEILVNPDLLEEMITVYDKTRASAVNLISPITLKTDHDDPNVVKAVTALDDRIVFLSRAPIPSTGREKHQLMFQQTGVIAYSARFLREYSAMEQTPMEVIESIDMLRLIENNLPLYSVKAPNETLGVDTEQDLLRASNVLQDDPWTCQYLNSMNQTK